MKTGEDGSHTVTIDILASNLSKEPNIQCHLSRCDPASLPPRFPPPLPSNVICHGVTLLPSRSNVICHGVTSLPSVLKIEDGQAHAELIELACDPDDGEFELHPTPSGAR